MLKELPSKFSDLAAFVAKCRDEMETTKELRGILAFERWHQFSEYTKLGFTRDEALKLLIAEIATFNVDMNLGGDK